MNVNDYVIFDAVFWSPEVKITFHLRGCPTIDFSHMEIDFVLSFQI